MAGEKVKPPVLVKPVVRKPLTKTQMLVSPARLVIRSARRAAFSYVCIRVCRVVDAVTVSIVLALIELGSYVDYKMHHCSICCNVFSVCCILCGSYYC